MELLRKYLELLYNNINRLFFDGTLPPAVINFSYTERQKIFRVIRLKNDQFLITINWTYLDCTEEELYINMIHQMGHIYNASRGIKDTSRSARYHNKKWSKAVAKAGVLTKIDNEDKKSCVGWYAVGIEADTVNKIREFFDFNKFREAVLERTEPGMESQLAVYLCPYCRRTVYAVPKSDNIIICGYDFNKYIRLD